MDSIYRGEVGVGCGWEAEDGLYHLLEQEQGRCVFNEAQKQPQCSYMSGRWQQFDTTCNLIVLPTPCSGLS